MSTATAPAPKAAPTPAAQTKSVLDQVLEKACEYTPFMAKEPIKLSSNLVMSHLCRPTRSGQRCSKQDAERFIMLCQARGLNPWEGDAFIVGYDGKEGPEFNLVTAHQAFLKRAEVHPEYDGMESGATVRVDGALHDIEGDLVPPGAALVGGWARVHKKNRRVPTYRRLELKTFDKGYSRWKIDPAGMIVKCAEADALRSAFPNSLGGMYLADEMPDDSVAGSRDSSLPKAESAHRLSDVLAAKAADIRSNGASESAASKPVEPEPSIDDQAAEADASERKSRLHRLLLTLDKPRRTYAAELNKLHAGKDWDELTADEQETELNRLESLLPVNA